MRRRKHQRRTTRIYYNDPGKTPLWWTVRFTDAKRPVTLNGSLQDALDSSPGTTIGCQLSLCAKRNHHQFPHPCILAAFTKRIAFIITHTKGGKPSDAVRYFHNHTDVVNLNDTDGDKRVRMAKPMLSERQFNLEVPPKYRKQPKRATTTGKRDGSRTPRVMTKGALARAVAAGLISEPVAKALRE